MNHALEPTRRCVFFSWNAFGCSPVHTSGLNPDAPDEPVSKSRGEDVPDVVANTFLDNVSPDMLKNLSLAFLKHRERESAFSSTPPPHSIIDISKDGSKRPPCVGVLKCIWQPWR
jgi:hypothetical protein